MSLCIYPFACGQSNTSNPSSQNLMYSRCLQNFFFSFVHLHSEVMESEYIVY